MMFPYPSAEGLHAGNMFAFTGSDVYGRFKRMQSHDVFEPMGLDGFGIHAENYALKIGKHPMDQAKVTESNFYKQLHQIGSGFAWENKLQTYDPDYYRWTQWLFIKLFKAGLAYKKKAKVNWCPSCKTVLSDEQIIGGECERCQSVVSKKELEQWFFKITDYADRLLANLDKIDWPEKIKTAQRNWIGRSETKKGVKYHLHDWLISRQRYWGPPIPMIYCEKCAWQPVPEEDLPVVLPYIKDYQPIGTGKGPLASHKEFYEAKCPNCNGVGVARRETDVSDTFLDSSWYFLRYPSVVSASSKKIAFDPETTKKWLPVDLYFGGAEHAVLHLMYARFITMFLYDQKLINFEEPFPKFYAHGLVIKDGAKMSKSRGNVVNPDEYMEKYGADTLRLYLMFMGPMDSYPDFRDTGIEGMRRFLEKLWRLFNQKPVEKMNSDIAIKMHQTMKKVTEDIEEFRYNTAISSIMELVNVVKEKKGATKEQLEVLVKLIAPFAPHIAEEVWGEVLDNKFSVHTNGWPKYDLKYLEVDELKIIVQVNGKMRSQITIFKSQFSNKKEIEKIAKRDDKVIKWVSGGIKKTIYVPGKIVNFVTK